MKWKIALFLGSVLAAGMASMPSAQAALMSCPSSWAADGTALVHDGGALPGVQTAVSACQYLTPADPSNVASIGNINAAGFFGYSDWEGNGQIGMQGAGSIGSSGTWSISNANFSLYDYVIVFKSGANTNLTAFLFNEEFTAGAWSTPFLDGVFNLPGNATSRAVSHISIVRRESTTPPPTPVPEPASLALFGAGLVGLVVARRQRKETPAA